MSLTTATASFPPPSSLWCSELPSMALEMRLSEPMRKNDVKPASLRPNSTRSTATLVWAASRMRNPTAGGPSADASSYKAM
eukprot:365602-Chlamydomonas_euryale.AAC.17